MERCAWIDVVLTVSVTSVTKQGFVREGVSKDGLDTFVRVCHLKRNMYLLLISLTHQFFFSRFRINVHIFKIIFTFSFRDDCIISYNLS